MTCGRYESWIALAAGGDLPPRRARRLERHLGECERCREYAAAMASAREAFQALGEEVVWDADVQAVRTAVMSRVAGEQVRPAFGWPWVFAPVAALAGVFMVMIWASVTEPRPSGSGQEPVGPQIAVDARQPLPHGRGSVGSQRRGPIAHAGGQAKAPTPQTARLYQGLPKRDRQGAVSLAARHASAQAGHSRTPPAIQAIAPREPDGDIVVRLETNDPKVVIYWVMETGESE